MPTGIPPFVAIIAYIIALFFIGIGNAAVTYHILRYRDPNDISGTILVIYYIFVMVILIGTALLIDWRNLFGG